MGKNVDHLLIVRERYDTDGRVGVFITIRSERGGMANCSENGLKRNRLFVIKYLTAPGGFHVFAFIDGRVLRSRKRDRLRMLRNHFVVTYRHTPKAFSLHYAYSHNHPSAYRSNI